MSSPNFGADSLFDQAESFKTFLGVNQPEPGDKFFIVMGLTGAGKSTFISDCTGHGVVVGHGLYSCTNSVGVFQYTSHGQRIFVIDTPGFNDTTRSDIDTLEILATYLAVSGFASNNNLVLVTTMWPESPSSIENTILEERELELLTNHEFFGDLVTKGATMFRHYERGYSKAGSGRRIVDSLARKLEGQSPGVLQLQREVVDEKMNLGETTAGIAAAEYLYKARLEHGNHLKRLNTELERTSVGSDREYCLQLRELKAEVDKEIQQTEQGRQALVKTMVDLHQTETKSLKQRIFNLQSRFEAEVQNKEIMLRDVQESCDALQNEVARLTNHPQQQQLVTRRTKTHQKALLKARKDAEKSRRDRQRVQEYTKEIIGGVMNGMAASAVAGVSGQSKEPKI
ncbi:GTP binding domain [Fusarium sporotrichioides]|uniref:GTP binding domain n=1 Tax=Fusarium sporotrichioides TaxID=5514 RepID=A0A395SD78_FUSSP|nr:GTP binding domain [Fusarium sporotrichioides]